MNDGTLVPPIEGIGDLMEMGRTVAIAAAIMPDHERPSLSIGRRTKGLAVQFKAEARKLSAECDWELHSITLSLPEPEESRQPAGARGAVQASGVERWSSSLTVIVAPGSSRMAAHSVMSRVDDDGGTETAVILRTICGACSIYLAPFEGEEGRWTTN